MSGATSDSSPSDEGFKVTPEQQALYDENLDKIVKLQAHWKGDSRKVFVSCVWQLAVQQPDAAGAAEAHLAHDLAVRLFAEGGIPLGDGLLRRKRRLCCRYSGRLAW